MNTFNDNHQNKMVQENTVVEKPIAEKLVVEETVSVNHLKFAIKIWGDENLPSILALHGWLDNAASFDFLAPLLSKYRVIAIDQCGHGRSDHRPLGVPYHFVDYVADAFYIADALGLDKFLLLGHSMGANVATTMAAAIPERIKALMLIEGFGPATREIEQTTSNLRDSIQRFSKNNSNKKSYADFSVLVKARLQGHWPLSKEAAELLCERGSVEKDGKFTWSSDPRINFTSPLRFGTEQARFIRSQVSCPTQIIVAEQGIAPEVSKDKSPLSEFTHARITRLEGKHHLHLDRQHVGRVAEVLLSFLAGLNNTADLLD